MKVCPYCGSAADDSSNFCQKCGARFQEPVGAPFPGGNAYSQQRQRPQPQPRPAKKAKKGSKGRTLLIVLAVFAALAIFGNYNEKRLRDKESPASDQPGSGTSQDVGVRDPGGESFDKGAISGGWYRNDWAELYFDMSGWSDGDAEEYASANGVTDVIGAVLVHDTGMAEAIVGFERLEGLNQYISEERYLNISTESIEQSFQSSGLTFTKSAYTDAYVAGNPYKAVTYNFAESGSVESVYVRNHDGYMIYIIVVATDAREGGDVINRFRGSAAEGPPVDGPGEQGGAVTPTQGGLVYTDGRVPHYTGTAPQWETLRYEWPRQDRNGTLWMELNLDAEMYRHYRGLERYQGVENYHYYTDDANNRAIIAEIVRLFRQVSGDIQYSEDDTVREVANFVQNVITYEMDSDTTGQEEYPRYPIETLYERRGDCEDTSILMAALLRELGYEVGFFHLPGHVAVALRTTDDYSAGAYYEVNGRRYLYIESTATGWNIGDIPDDMMDVEATFYALS